MTEAEYVGFDVSTEEHAGVGPRFSSGMTGRRVLSAGRGHAGAEVG